MRPRLYLDEDILPGLAEAFRRHGVDAISAHEIGALTLDDDQQLELATAENRVILTCNYHDFNRIAEQWSQAGRIHPGIIVSYRQYRRDELGVLTRTVLAALDVLDAEAIAGSVQVLDQYRPR